MAVNAITMQSRFGNISRSALNTLSANKGQQMSNPNTMTSVLTAVDFHYRPNRDPKVGAVGEKRASVRLELAIPKIEGIIARESYSSDEAYSKGLALLQSCVLDVVKGYARELLENCDAETFPHAQVSWEALATLPPAIRTGGGIPQETWTTFLADYQEVMPSLTGKSAEQIKNAATILKSRLSNVKTSKDHLQFFQMQLAIYTSGAPRAEEFVDIIDFLSKKIEEYLGLDSKELLKNL